MNAYLKILAFFALAAGLWAFGSSNQACATIANQTCDTAVWTDMSTRARMETEREIMQNQNLIFKPDSILAYTCFDSMAAHVGAQAGVLFTHTKYWEPQPILWGDQGKYVGMDVAVKNLVTNAMNTYYQSNFQHAMLGGRSLAMGGGDAVGMSMSHAVKATPSSSSKYACGVMGQVWAMAKCMNFMHNSDFADIDGYYPFIDLQGSQPVAGYETKNDVRKYPSQCNGGPFYEGSTWKNLYEASRNGPFSNPNQNYNFGQRVKETFDAVRKRVEPGMCGDPIKTGVKVILSPGATQTFDDGVCTNPGCTYTKQGKCVGGSADAGSPSALYQ